MHELDWGAWLTLAAVVSAACAIVAAAVSVGIWRRGADDRAQVAALARVVARIEMHQESEDKHVLRPRDLGAIHERINRVAEELAATRAQASTETRMLSEQLSIVQRLLETHR